MSKIKVQDTIKSIISGKISDIELKKIFLDEEENVALLFATIKTIGSKKIFDEQIKNKLLKLTEMRELTPFIMGNYSIGDLAISSLLLNGVSVEEIPMYQSIPIDRKQSIDDLVKHPDW